MKKNSCIITCLLLSAYVQTNAQKTAPGNSESIDRLRNSVNYLADDKLEGRRTGTTGEKLAYEFISAQFKKNGLSSLGDSKQYTQAFTVAEGKELTGTNFLTVNKHPLDLNKDYYPLPYSANSSSKELQAGIPKFSSVDVNVLIDANKDNPHFDLQEAILAKIKDDASAGNAAVFIINGLPGAPEEKFDAQNKTVTVELPAFYITEAGLKKFDPRNSQGNIEWAVSIGPKSSTGHNVVGFVNNHAAENIIIGAHYDHLGYGQDHNSLYSGTTPMVHNGADDNASGTAALIELGGWLKNAGLKKYNYLLVAFSGEELGLYGSKYFVEHPPVNLSTVNYMINMDMVGRLNDSTHGLTIGGFGTAKEWGQILKINDPFFKIKTDSSGSGPSDHTSFYRKNIPVLFFFTGTHSDYHKPSDDATKINFNGELAVINYIKSILALTNELPKLSFLKTREVSMGKSSFKVSLGIMPDYTFAGSGVLVDGVSEGKAAQKAGIKTGDVLVQLGEHSFSDVQTYMNALNKFNKGEATTVKLKRGNEEVILPVVF